MFKDFFYRFPENFIRCFRGVNLLWHLLAIVLTYVCVVSGLDWWYFGATRSRLIFDLAFPAALLGFFVPVFLPLGIYFFGALRRSPTLKKAGSALVQAGILGSVISSLYKAFTGRPHPELITHLGNADLSRIFDFGLLKGGIFFGWPSSHTAVAFAMTTALIVLFPRRKLVIALALIYAFYIGLGVSVTIHWFSDFLAGAIIGTVIGSVVGLSFKAR